MSVDEQLVAPGDPERIAYVLDVIGQRRGVAGARVLDLAARTGRFSLALAEAGATVTAIEGRCENFDVIPQEHPRIKARHADVRSLIPTPRGREKRYDVALCLGLLYHLEPGDALGVLRALRRVVVPGGFVIIDTHVSRRAELVEVEGVQYLGHWYQEWPGRWSSIDNPRSWWFTAPSLELACRQAGWENVDKLDGVRWPGEPADREWLVLS